MEKRKNKKRKRAGKRIPGHNPHNKAKDAGCESVKRRISKVDRPGEEKMSIGAGGEGGTP